MQTLRAFLIVASLAFAAEALAQTDPLPSWNAGPAKNAIVEFVQTTTDTAKLLLNDNDAGKPEGIHFMIGRRPYAAFGNSNGDRQMLEYTRGGNRVRLAMLVLHDDAKREYEIDLALFRRAQRKAVTFGLITTIVPLLLGTAVGLLFGYRMVTAVVMGSLLASHTLLGMAIVTKIGANRLEPFIVTVGATVLSDMLSLVVFAMCVSTFERGFSLSGLAVQLIEIAVFVPVLLLGVGRGGRYLLKKAEDDEQAYFILMFGIMACAVTLSRVVQLPGIVGAFLAGLAVNSAVQHKPAKEKLEFIGNSFFIPIFFVVTGFLIDPIVFARSIIDNAGLAAAVVGALIIGKGIAAAVAARAFDYSRPAQMTMWSLTLPQVAATLAATLVGFDTVDPEGRRLIDERILDVVFVLILVTATIGPIMTQRYAPLMLASAETSVHRKSA